MSLLKSGYEPPSHPFPTSMFALPAEKLNDVMIFL